MGLIVFLSASGWSFPISSLLVLNTIIYVFIDGHFWDLSYIICYSNIAKIFILIVLLDAFSYLYLLSYDFPNAFLLKDANHYTLFTFSIVWFCNFLFSSIYVVHKTNYKYLFILTAIFFICAIYSNYRAYSYNRQYLEIVTQHHYYYFLLVCIPLLFIKANKLFRYLILIIVLFASFYSFKRTGVIVVAAVSFLCFLFDVSRSIKNVLLGFFLFVVALILMSQYVDNSTEAGRTMIRMEKIYDDRGSGRGDNILEVIELVAKSPVEKQLLGHGFMSWSVEKKRMIDVEWASMLYYYGIFGLILYALFYLALFDRVTYIHSYCHFDNNNLLCAYLSCMIIFMIYSFAGELFSYQYLSSLLFVFLGTVEGYLVSNTKLIIRVREDNY